MKVRVYEIAHEYGQSTRHVIDVLHRISAGVHSASTPLEPLVVARLRAELEGRRSAMRPSVVSDPMDDVRRSSESPVHRSVRLGARDRIRAA